MATRKPGSAEGVSEDQVASRVLALRREIEEHNRLYYQEDAPRISDATYDALLRELEDLETAHPGLVTADSPTENIFLMSAWSSWKIAPRLLPAGSLQYSPVNCRGRDPIHGWCVSM